MPNSQEPRRDEVTREQKSALLLLFVTFFIDILGFGLVLTLNPYYVERYPTLFGHTVGAGAAVGLLTACYPILQLICAPFWGRLSDRVGRRPIILLSLLGNSMAWLLFGLAHSLEVLFLARMLSGALSSASLPTVQAYIADSTPPQKRSVWIGIVVGMGFSFGFMLGPPLGGFLATNPWPDLVNRLVSFLPGGKALISGDHLTYPAFLAAGIAFANFLVSLKRLPESLSPELRAHAGHRSAFPLQEFSRALREPALGVMLLILGLSTFAMQTMEQNVTLYGSKDVVTTAHESSWDRLTPKFLQGHSVIAVRYSPTFAPSASTEQTIRQALDPSDPSQAAVVADPAVTSGVTLQRHLIEKDTGEILGIVAFIVGMIQGGALKRLVPRFGEVPLVLMGNLVAAVGFFLVPGAHNFLLLAGAVSVIAVGTSFIAPCLRGLISQETDVHSQGSVLGVSESVRGLAMATGPLIGGALFDRGAALPFVLGGACLLVGAGLVVLLRSAQHRNSGVVEPAIAS